MKRLQLPGLALIATLALSAVAATAAQAEGPLLDILPEKAKFTFESRAGEKIKIETLAGKKVECTKFKGSAEALTERLGDLELKLEGCEGALGAKCTGLGDAVTGNITITGAEFHLRHLLNPSEAWVNLAILWPHIHFSCDIVLLLILGCVASIDLLTEPSGINVVNLLLKTIFVDFLQEKGDQRPLLIDTDNSLGMETCEMKTKEGTGGAYESSGLLGSGTIKFETTGLIDLSGTQ